MKWKPQNMQVSRQIQFTQYLKHINQEKNVTLLRVDLGRECEEWRKNWRKRNREAPTRVTGGDDSKVREAN
jgi:hypothetical protein